MNQICVLGMGYIGLPTASMLAINGCYVTGMDINPATVEKIKSCNIQTKESGLDMLLERAIKSGNLKIQEVISESEIYIICVPTPITERKKTDLSFVKSATESIVPKIKCDDHVILESTVPPGTTINVVKPMLEKSGLSVGKDIYLSHCPERVMPGNILNEIVKNDRIIGGFDMESAIRAEKIYKKFVDGRIFLTDATTAELVKLIENTYRAVNIALANELALIAEKLQINVIDAINLANNHPRVNIHNPGPGTGGHCIPIDPWFIVESAQDVSRLIPLAMNINENMPSHVVDLLLDAFKDAGKGVKESKVVILGASYKGDVDDKRMSPALPVFSKLIALGTKDVVVYDPYVTNFEYPVESDFFKAIKDADALVIITDHSEFKYMNPSNIMKLMKSKPILVDSRNIIKDYTGFIFRGVGIGK